MTNSVTQSTALLPILPLQCVWMRVKFILAKLYIKITKEVRSVREIITPRNTTLV